MSGATITAVTFDFWQTLVRDTPEGLARAREMRLRSVAEILDRAGCPKSASTIEEAYERCAVEMAARAWTLHRDLSIRDQVTIFLDCLEERIVERLGEEQFVAAVEGYSVPVLHAPPVLTPGAEEAVRGLAARGCRLGIVSNTGRTPGATLRRLLDRYGLLGHFQAISYSDEVGFRKPHPEIFDRTLKLLGVSPAEALHVGDNPDDDVLGALGFGMRSAHYVPDGAPASPDADLTLTFLGDLPESVARLAR
jgi:putative hydrolase of the HAD superfamily